VAIEFLTTELPGGFTVLRGGFRGAVSANATVLMRVGIKDAVLKRGDER